MRKIIYLLSAIVALASCSKPASGPDKEISLAEHLMESNADSALAILEAIDPSDLKTDSLKAKFHYLKAFGHMKANRSMVGDSLIYKAHNYYRGKDIVNDMRSGTALAFYKFWVGDTRASIAILDSCRTCPIL